MDSKGSGRSPAAAARRRIIVTFRGLWAALGPALAVFLLLSLVLLGGVGLLAAQVVGREATALELVILSWMLDAEASWLDNVALEVTALGANPVLLALAAAVAAAFWVGRYRGEACVLLVAAVGSILLNQVLKHAFERPRPEILEARAHVASPLAFPSSHATVAMATYLVLAWLLARQLASPVARAAVFALAGAAVAVIGVSRVYLGVHYPSDVLAGWGVGFVWATACLAGGRLIGGLDSEGQGCRANTRVAPSRSKRRTS